MTNTHACAFLVTESPECALSPTCEVTLGAGAEAWVEITLIIMYWLTGQGSKHNPTVSRLLCFSLKLLKEQSKYIFSHLSLMNSCRPRDVSFGIRESLKEKQGCEIFFDISNIIS